MESQTIQIPPVGHQYFEGNETRYHGVIAREFGVFLDPSKAIKGAFCNLDCRLFERGYSLGEVSSYTVYVLNDAAESVLAELDTVSAGFFRNPAPKHEVVKVNALKSGNILEISAIVTPKNN